jgi:predicted DNA-binding transcriptional regulator AlpA
MSGKDDRLIDLKEVEYILGLKKTKLYAMMKEGTLDKPKKFGSASRWSERRIRRIAGLLDDESIEALL